MAGVLADEGRFLTYVIEISPNPGDPNVGFIDPPGSIRDAQLATNALIQNGPIPLHPAPDRNVVDGEAALRHDFFQVPIAEGVPQIPSDAEHDDYILEMSSTEQRWSLL